MREWQRAAPHEERLAERCPHVPVQAQAGQTYTLFHAMRMPLPPPPADALIMTG
jgi:hypothetical protein